MTKQRPTVHTQRHRFSIDVRGMHLREVDHHAAIGGRFAGEAVTATLYGKEKFTLAGEIDGVDDVINGRRLGDHGRPFVIKHAVPHQLCGVVSFVVLQEQLPFKTAAELLYGSRLD